MTVMIVIGENYQAFETAVLPRSLNDAAITTGVDSH